jgi:cobalt-zinc-cadmium efflux system outer membrane protein
MGYPNVFPARRDIAANGAAPWLALLLVSLWLVAPAAASPTLIPGADLDSVRAWLIERNPELRALQAEAEAAQARVLPAGALPDPMAEVELMGIDPDRPSLLPGNVDATTWRVRQSFPMWGKRGLAREVARHEASAAGLDREAVALDLLARAEEAYVRFWHAREAVAVLDRQIELLGQLEEVARTRYSLGIAAQQDSIRAQVARTGLQHERITRLAARAEAAAMLNAVLARPVDAPLAEPASEPELPLPAERLDQVLAMLADAGHPALQASAARTEAAEAAFELQRRARYPDLSLGFGVIQRDDREEGYEVMLAVEIPLQQRARREREREARLRGDAARARSDALAAGLAGQLGQVWSQARAARDQRRLIEQTLVPQAQANFESALASYRVGEVDFGTLLEALDAWQGAALAQVDARRDELVAAAAVGAITGGVR